MPVSDTSEKGLESLIVASLVDGGGYVEGDPADYDRAHAVDLPKLLAFLKATQPAMHAKVYVPSDEERATLGLAGDERTQRAFLARLSGEISRRGIVDVLRTGIKHREDHIGLYASTPTPGNTAAEERRRANIFSVTRQLRYSTATTGRALDLVLFLNGLPLATFELKNRLTGQTVADAVQQYRRDRDPRELLFMLGRCLVHFAVDEDEVQMCTHLEGAASWFLPFNKGVNDGAGNPVNPHGLKTAYLWEEILRPRSLSDIIENYAQRIEEKDDRGRVHRRQIFPRYHQLDVVRRLLAAVQEDGVGHRYLVQHSAGSGKSNSIAWLARQLVGVQQSGVSLLDSVIIVTDRRVLDKQLRDTIKAFNQVGANFSPAQTSNDLAELLKSGKKIITTTVQKFRFVLEALANQPPGRRFAILIDEAHSSQSGRSAAQMNAVLGGRPPVTEDGVVTDEDIVNQLMEQRHMLSNAVYIAFTATPKPKTLQTFGVPPHSADGEPTFSPFHKYTMKQAIEEGFILDVLASYTTVNSYYHVVSKTPDDPLVETKKARRALRRYVEMHDYAIETKARIIVDHFQEQVYARRKIGGQARAMVVTRSIQAAITYYHAIKTYLEESRSPLRAIVAFSGEPNYGGAKVTEASLNRFPSGKITEKFVEDPYRFLVVADKFQTGYDEPLLHTMYVDKVLAGIQAVQTLSRLNRAYPGKHDTFVLDFENSADEIQQAFAPYYRTTILSGETDPNKLHDLKALLDDAGVYAPYHVEDFVAAYLAGAHRDRLDPLLDACVERYRALPDVETQVKFKGAAKAFVRTYNFLAAILPFTNADWERLSVFLTYLIPKLPSPDEADLSAGILDAINLDSYRAEVQTALSIALPDENAIIEPIPVSEGSGPPDPARDHLSAIVIEFNDLFGNIAWKDADKIREVIRDELPPRVAADPAYRNAVMNSDEQNARIEHDRALTNVITDLLADHTELFRRFHEFPNFRDWLSRAIFDVTYHPRGNDTATAALTPEQRAARLIHHRFGSGEATDKWLRINRALWATFAGQDVRLGLFEVDRIAATLDVEERDVSILLALLAQADPPLVRRIYYRQSRLENIAEVSPDEVMHHFALSRSDDEADRAAWERFANEVLIGWVPVSVSGDTQSNA